MRTTALQFSREAVETTALSHLCEAVEDNCSTIFMLGSWGQLLYDFCVRQLGTTALRFGLRQLRATALHSFVAGLFVRSWRFGVCFTQVVSGDHASFGRRSRWRFYFVPLISVIVTGDIARLLGAFQLQMILLHHVVLDHIAARLIDGMGYIGIEFIGGVVLPTAIISDPRATVVAVIAADVIFVAASRTTIGQFPAGHRHKGAMASFDNLQVSDDKTIIKGNGAEGSQAIFRFLH